MERFIDPTASVGDGTTVGRFTVIESSAVVGAAISIVIGNVASDYSPILLALTAGAFIYIAASDLIPELHRSPGRKAALVQLILMAAGVGVMLIPRIVAGVH